MLGECFVWPPATHAERTEIDQFHCPLRRLKFETFAFGGQMVTRIADTFRFRTV